VIPNDSHQIAQRCPDSDVLGRAALPGATMPVERVPHAHFLGLLATCVLAAIFVGCASPAPRDSRDSAPRSSAADPSGRAGPRFAQGGPDAGESRLVMIHTAVRKRARDPGIREENALWRGLVQQLGH
jgi:hypothetical protein